jgi:hypothetical protein
MEQVLFTNSVIFLPSFLHPFDRDQTFLNPKLRAQAAASETFKQQASALYKEGKAEEAEVHFHTHDFSC